MGSGELRMAIFLRQDAGVVRVAAGEAAVVLAAFADASAPTGSSDIAPSSVSYTNPRFVAASAVGAFVAVGRAVAG